MTVTGLTTVAKLSGNFKEVYGSKINNLLPDGVKLLKLFEFSQAERIGNYFHQPAVMTGESGFTHAAAGAGAFSLEQPVSAVMQDAQVSAYQILLRGALDYESAARAASSVAAFEQATSILVKNMKLAIAKRLEILCLYGQAGIGASNSFTASGSNVSVVFSAGSWSPGTWIGSIGMKFDAYNSTSQVNGNAALVVVSVDVDTRTVVFSGNSTDITDLIALTGTAIDFYFYGAYGAEMAGLSKIITNSSSLFNIDAGTYDLWKGNQYDVGSVNLTLGKILKGVSLAANRGLEEKAFCLVSNNTWSDLMTDQAGLRKYDASYSNDEAKNGSRFIRFFAQTGEIEVIPSIYVKQGEAFLLPKSIKRIGSTDITFNLPGRQDTEFFLHLPDQSGYELRSYTAQQIFAEAPAHCVKMTNIVNNA